MRVRLENIHKSFGPVEVVKGLDLEVQDGEFLVLLGASGSGKTTALRMIAGLESVTSGRIRIGERDVTKVLPKHRDVAMVFQSYALYPHMTVFANIAYPLSVRRRSKAEIKAAVNDVARQVQLDTLLDRYPRQLSGGQRQRVALARAMIRRPAAFLMDEPLSNLDAKLRVQMRAEIKELHQRLTTTTVYVTHDQVEAMTMADRIVVMRDGVIEQSGLPLDLYDRPANLFVAGFIGSPSMNLLKGAIRMNGKPSFVTDEGVTLPLMSAPAGSENRRCIYGFRPEHLNLGGDVRAEVSVTEPTGSETQVICKLGGQKVVGVFRERIDVKPGESLPVSPRLDSVHLFDAGTGMRLSS